MANGSDAKHTLSVDFYMVNYGASLKGALIAK